MTLWRTGQEHWTFFISHFSIAQTGHDFLSSVRGRMIDNWGGFWQTIALMRLTHIKCGWPGYVWSVHTGPKRTGQKIKMDYIIDNFFFFFSFSSCSSPSPSSMDCCSPYRHFFFSFYFCIIYTIVTLRALWALKMVKHWILIMCLHWLLWAVEFCRLFWLQKDGNIYGKLAHEHCFGTSTWMYNLQNNKY